MMAIKPILFNTQMAKAIMEGRKTQTRRVVKPVHGGNLEMHVLLGNPRLSERYGSRCCGLKPPCEQDDILWVREAYCALPVTRAGHIRGHDVYYYWADGDLRPDGWRGNWHPSIHMPKEAARIFLRVKDVWVERLQDIDDDGVVSEGLEIGDPFDEIWDSTIKKADLPRYGWDANPWVWGIEFEHCDKPEGWCE